MNNTASVQNSINTNEILINIGVNLFLSVVFSSLTFLAQIREKRKRQYLKSRVNALEGQIIRVIGTPSSEDDYKRPESSIPYV